MQGLCQLTTRAVAAAGSEAAPHIGEIASMLVSVFRQAPQACVLIAARSLVGARSELRCGVCRSRLGRCGGGGADVWRAAASVDRFLFDERAGPHAGHAAAGRAGRLL
jgi:hypothetical protein